jgi:hypothetical protein
MAPDPFSAPVAESPGDPRPEEALDVIAVYGCILFGCLSGGVKARSQKESRRLAFLGTAFVF